MKKKQIALNAVVAVIQTLVSGITLFVLYRYLLDTIGIEQMGVWSVVLATTSASKISELGLSGGVIKFVAKYNALKQPEVASVIIETAAISVTILLTGVALLSYFPFIYLLKFIIPEQGLISALAIFPYALISFLIMGIAGIYQSGLEGCNRVDLKGYVLIFSNITYFIVTFLLVPKYGLLGMAYAQVIQSSLILILSLILLRNSLPQMPLFRLRWDRSLFKEMVGYGVNMQINGIVAMLFEPMTKAMLTKFGGLAMVGFFEMASRMIMQFRLLLVSANQVLVPVIAGLQETSPNKIQEIYKQSYGLLLFLSLPFFGGLAAVTPSISEMWIGQYESMFVFFCLLCIFGWLCNTVTAPAYIGYVGSGRLRWNTLSHILIGAINGLLGIILGLIYGGVGVVVAWLVALVVGSWVVPYYYHKENKIPFNFLFPSEFFGLLFSTFIGIWLGWVAYFHFEKLNAILVFLICSGVFLLSVVVAAWRHPMKDTIVGFVKNKTSSSI